jgi:hypothetical protein
MNEINFNETQRIRLSLANDAAALTVQAILELIQEFGYDPADVDEGWTVYEGMIERRIDVTFHKSTVNKAITFWIAARSDGFVDCGRIYAGDGDWCCKHLHNLQSRGAGNADSFPGYNG